MPAFVVFVDPEDAAVAMAGSPVVGGGNVLQHKVTDVQEVNPEKENFDPVTGCRIAGVSSKKRKSPALTPKTLPALTIRTNSDPVIKQPSVKKAKGLTVARPVPKRKTSERRPSGRPSPRRTYTMPDIREESPAKVVTQNLIDERVYDLTVSPLADVTSMFEMFDAVMHIDDSYSLALVSLCVFR